MAKKLTLPLAAVAVVLALVLPATAAAEDVLLPVGTTIRITSKTLSLTSSKIGTIKCAEWTWQGVLNENGGKLLIKEMPGSAKECSTSNGVGVVMNATEIKPTQIAEGEVEKGTLHWMFNATINKAITCTWEGNGTFTYKKGTDEGTFKEATLTATPAGCGASAKLTGEATDLYQEGAEWKPIKWL